MADDKPDTARPAGGPSAGQGGPGQSQPQGPAAEAAMMDLRLTAEEQASDLGDLGLRLAREVSGRMTESVLRLNELNRDLAVMQVDTLRRLSACRTPQEILEVQQDYWRACVDSAVEGGRRLVELPLGLPAAWGEAVEPMAQRTVRHMDRAMPPG